MFWIDIKRFYIDTINHFYQCGALTELQNQSIISLISKSDKDTTFLENWRPISLSTQTINSKCVKKGTFKTNT